MKYPRTPGIYSIVHIASGRCYIGSTRNLYERLRHHRLCLKKGIHHCPHLQNAWSKYGENAFRIDLLESCLDEPVILVAREQHWMDRFKGKLFNSRPFSEQYAREWYATEAGKAYAKVHSAKMSEWSKSHPYRECVCKHCGNQFASRDSKIRLAQFCSQKCRVYYKATHQYAETRECKECKKQFTVSRYKPNVFCSKSCGLLASWRERPRPPKRTVLLTCPQCGKEFHLPWRLRDIQKCCGKSCASKLRKIWLGRWPKA